MSADILRERRSGVVLHPTSLPGPHGSGDLGPNAYYFVDWLEAAGQTLWQTLPLGPVGPGYSPYMGTSAMAGNPMLVALEPLLDKGWLSLDAAAPSFDALHIDFPQVMRWRMERLREAYQGFLRVGDVQAAKSLQRWSEQHASWLDDYALFMALNQEFGAPSWTSWPQPLAQREPKALQDARRQHAHEIGFWQFVQWTFDQQWQALRTYAHSKQVLLIGDLPIFVAHHSADCWANPGLFKLDALGQPAVVAGVPPDFFSATGQWWGNPLYDWAAMKADGYRWWIARLQRQLALCDGVRIDHFRGFVDYWEIEADQKDARQGRWQEGPGMALFDALANALGDLPIIAEDLGIITDEVRALRAQTGFPGMRVLQFAFDGDARHPFLPHNYEANTVVYCGTHDNDTVQGWWTSCSPAERQFADRYLAGQGSDIHWRFLRTALFSVANWSLCQFQDVLGLGSEHRMNVPGTTGCWTWRFSWDWVGPQPAQQLRQLSALAGRLDDLETVRT